MMDEVEQCDFMNVQSEQLLEILEAKDDENEEEVYVMYDDEEIDSELNDPFGGKFSLFFFI